MPIFDANCLVPDLKGFGQIGSDLSLAQQKIKKRLSKQTPIKRLRQRRQWLAQKLRQERMENVKVQTWVRKDLEKMLALCPFREGPSQDKRQRTKWHTKELEKALLKALKSC